MFCVIILFVMAKENGFNMELFFAALADRTRLRLLNILGKDEVCVCFFAEVIGTNQPKISRHLAYLKRAELVSNRRDGKWIHYRVIEPKNERAKEVFAGVREMLKEDKEMQADRKKLLSVCCGPMPQQPVSIQGALVRKAYQDKSIVR
jgi:ArsR family transcriptional regulator